MLSYFLNSVLHSFMINSVTLLSSMLNIVYILILENVMKIRVIVDTVLTRENLELRYFIKKYNINQLQDIRYKSANKDYEAQVKLILC